MLVHKRLKVIELLNPSIKRSFKYLDLKTFLTQLGIYVCMQKIIFHLCLFLSKVYEANTFYDVSNILLDVFLSV